MVKKYSSIIVSIVLCISIIISSTPASNAAMEASDYISSYYAILDAGDGNGEIDVSFYITSVAGVTMAQIGVTKIVVYRHTGLTYKTINGSTSNGLMATNTNGHAGTYTIQCVPGYSYYCKVTFYVGDGSNGDARTVTTRTISAPWYS